MSDKRDEALEEIISRLGPLINDSELTKIIKWPDAAPGKDDMPCALIIEADDEIVLKHSSNHLGYPCKREFMVIVETWAMKGDGNIRVKEKLLKSKILAEKGALVQGVTISEKKTVGPINANVLDFVGMRTFYKLRYTDNGPF